VPVGLASPVELVRRAGAGPAAHEVRVGLAESDRQSLLRQVKGGRQPGESATNDDDHLLLDGVRPMAFTMPAGAAPLSEGWVSSA
jgi:hypothetical protein